MKKPISHTFVSACLIFVALFSTASGQSSDEIAIERFISSDKIEELHGFTSDGNALIDSFKSFKLEAGQSAGIDAVYAAVEAVSEHNKFRLVYTSTGAVTGPRKMAVKLSAPNGEQRTAVTRRRYYPESNVRPNGSEKKSP